MRQTANASQTLRHYRYDVPTSAGNLRTTAVTVRVIESMYVTHVVYIVLLYVWVSLYVSTVVSAGYPALLFQLTV